MALPKTLFGSIVKNKVIENLTKENENVDIRPLNRVTNFFFSPLVNFSGPPVERNVTKGDSDQEGHQIQKRREYGFPFFRFME